MARVRPQEVVSVMTMLAALALLTLVVLSMAGVISLCRKTRRSPKRHLTPAGASPCQMAAEERAAAQLAASAAPPAAPSAGGAVGESSAKGGLSLIEMEAPDAMALIRQSDRDRVLYVLGQMSCPACQACKAHLLNNGHGQHAVFVDISVHGNMLKDGGIPRPVAQALGRGVPMLAVFSHRTGAVLQRQEGFSPQAVEAMVKMVAT
jgi:hypothetical protein